MSAPALPTRIEMAATTETIGAQLVAASISAVSKKRRKIPSAAAFVATAMNAVIGVGAPW